MRRTFGVLLISVLLSPLAHAAGVASNPVMGNWSGSWTGDDEDQGKLLAQVIALGKGEYLINFTVHVGEDPHKVSVKVGGKQLKGAIALSGKSQQSDESVVGIDAKVKQERMSGRYSIGDDGGGRFAMDRVREKSPTLGARPPQGAIVLFDGNNLAAWHRRGTDQPAGWHVSQGYAEVVKGKGDIVSNQRFGDHKLHVEFRTPFMPEARGQARGNSGVYLHGRYEVQVLDSFGLEGLDNECGGIYRQHRPQVNACLPPEEWQTYDITFHAARLNDAGEVVKPARLTVKHNGILIHDDVQAKGPTPAGLDEEQGGTGPLLLQDHGNPVRYRNIWVLPLDES